jgi:uncharacterized protein
MTGDALKGARNEQVRELLARYSKDFSDFDGLELGAVNQHGYGDDCPLHIAARHGLLDDARLLIDAGANVDSPGDVGLTPLHYAAMWGHVEMITLLINAGAKLEVKNDFGESPLHVAEQGQHAAAIAMLRKYGL